MSRLCALKHFLILWIGRSKTMPVQNLKMESFKTLFADPLIKRITAHLRACLPQVTAIIFFGSRVAGCADEFSDYDVMVLLPDGLEEDARDQVKRAMRAAFPKIKLDLVFGSERALVASLRVEAHYRFWLANGIATFGQVPTIKRFPPLYKDALDSRLNIIGSEIKVVEAWSRNLHQEARGYLRVLKQLVLIEHALKHDYSNRSLNADIEKMLGDQMIRILRDPRAPRSMRRPMLARVRRITRQKFNLVRRQVLRAKLPCKYPLPERTRV